MTLAIKPMSDNPQSNRDQPRHQIHLDGSESFLEADVGDWRPEARKLQTFRAGSLLCGVFEDEVATIVEWRGPTPLPHAPPAILGVVSIQGRMLTVIDIRSLFGDIANGKRSPHGFIMALRGDEQIALAVTDRGEIIELPGEGLTPSADQTGEFVVGTSKHSDEIVKVLDVRALFPAAIKGSERRRRRF